MKVVEVIQKHTGVDISVITPRKSNREHECKSPFGFILDSCCLYGLIYQDEMAGLAPSGPVRKSVSETEEGASKTNTSESVAPIDS